MIKDPLTPAQFKEGLSLLKPKYQAYAVLMYYTGMRVSEALRLRKESFDLSKVSLYVEVGVRLKTQRKRKDGTVSPGRRTQPLPLSLTLYGIDILTRRVRYIRKGDLVFPFNRTTARRQMANAGLGYNHLFRLSAITAFLKAGRSVADIVNWFGVTVQTVNSYIGLTDLAEMGALKR